MYQMYIKTTALTCPTYFEVMDHLGKMTVPKKLVAGIPEKERVRPAFAEDLDCGRAYTYQVMPSGTIYNVNRWVLSKFINKAAKCPLQTLFEENLRARIAHEKYLMQAEAAQDEDEQEPEPKSSRRDEGMPVAGEDLREQLNRNKGTNN